MGSLKIHKIYLQLLGFFFFIGPQLVLPTAHALTVKNVVYAMNCDVPDWNQTTSIAWLDVGTFTAKNVQNKQVWSWLPVIRYSGSLNNEQSGRILFVYEGMAEIYQFDSNSTRLISRTESGTRVIKDGFVVASGDPTITLKRCSARSSVTESHLQQRQVFLDSSQARARTEVQQEVSQSPPVASRATNVFDTCTQFQDNLIQNYYTPDRKRFSAYDCNSGTNSSNKQYLIISGKPGTQATEKFVYFFGSSCVFYAHSNGVSKVLEATTFEEVQAKRSDIDVDERCRKVKFDPEEEARILKERNKHPLCANDPMVGIRYDCDPERQMATQRALEQISKGKDPLTGQNICPSDAEQTRARHTCAPANNFKQCMKRFFPDYYLCPAFQ